MDAKHLAPVLATALAALFLAQPCVAEHSKSSLPAISVTNGGTARFNANKFLSLAFADAAGHLIGEAASFPLTGDMSYSLELPRSAVPGSGTRQFGTRAPVQVAIGDEGGVKGVFVGGG
jgi:hypothetical protein